MKRVIFAIVIFSLCFTYARAEEKKLSGGKAFLLSAAVPGLGQILCRR